MPKFAANISMMFTEFDFEARFEQAARAGFKAVEYLFPYEFDANRLAAKLKDNGLRQALFNLPPGDWEQGERGLAGIDGRQQAFRDSVKLALDYAEVIDCPTLHVMAGIVDDQQRAAAESVYVDNLAWAAEHIGRAGRQAVIEPINSARDMPGYLLNTSSRARHIIERVGSPHLGLQFDIYHCQIMEGDIAKRLESCQDIIRHIQIAGVPARNEPDIGEINYPYLFDHIDTLKFDAKAKDIWIGCEYRPKNVTTEGLGWFDRYRAEQ